MRCWTFRKNDVIPDLTDVIPDLIGDLPRKPYEYTQRQILAV